MKLLVATNNKHKLKEISEILNIFNINNIELLCASDFNKTIMPAEIGNSYHENAEIKASAFYKEIGLPTISDDSGLEIDFLDGAPGIYSSSFGGEEGNHKKNREKLLNILNKDKINEATARFRCIICYIDNEEKFFVEGVVEGKIIAEERGSNGFGYDPMFVPNGYNQTFAELNDFEKNKISHRARAIQNLIKELGKRNKI